MTLQKKDFIQIEFTGKTKEGQIFDSNIKEDLEKAQLNLEAKPFVFCLGEDMFLKGVDEFLIGKEIGKEYEIELEPEKAFGRRDPSKVELISAKVFVQHKLNPFPGAIFNFDGRIAKVLSVSGGRIRVDFNNPLAGKDVIYKVKIIKKIEDKKEKVKALNEFFFKKDFDSEIKENKLILKVGKGFKQFVELFKDKYKEILELELEVEEKNEQSKLNEEKK